MALLCCRKQRNIRRNGLCRIDCVYNVTRCVLYTRTKL